MAQPQPHAHSHNGQPHNHSHGPQQPPPMAQPAPDPLLQAALDARFTQISLKLVTPPDNKSPMQVTSTDPTSTLDFLGLNTLSHQLATQLPASEPVPPPINPQAAVSHPRSLAVVKAKDEGNKLYGQGKYAQAIQMYTTATEISMSRPPWESSNLIKDELAMVLSNRSAAHAITNDWVSALVDADAVVQVKRPWSKGHFRKAKALQGLGEYEEAKVALSLGLSFEPSNAEMRAFMTELDEQIKEQEAKKAARRAQKLQSPTVSTSS